MYDFVAEHFIDIISSIALYGIWFYARSMYDSMRDSSARLNKHADRITRLEEYAIDARKELNEIKIKLDKCVTSDDLHRTAMDIKNEVKRSRA